MPFQQCSTKLFGCHHQSWIACERCASWYHCACVGVAITNNNGFCCCDETSPLLNQRYIIHSLADWSIVYSMKWHCYTHTSVFFCESCLCTSYPSIRPFVLLWLQELINFCIIIELFVCQGTTLHQNWISGIFKHCILAVVFQMQ